MSPATPPCAASTTILVERRDLADGTTGRYHGLLHSGGRYAVKDPQSARECIAENQILRRVAADCIEDTGGLFVVTPWDDPAYGDRFLAGCRETGIPVEELAVGQALRREPRLHAGITRAFEVPDASLDPWKLVWGAHARPASTAPGFCRITACWDSGSATAGSWVRRFATS